MSSNNDWFNREYSGRETLNAYRSATPRTRNYRKQPWIPAVFVVAMGLGVLVLTIYGNEGQDAPTDPNPKSAPAVDGRAAPDEPSLHIHAGNSPQDEEPTYYRQVAPQTSTTAAPITYYQCVRNGEKILTDFPCSTSAAAITLDTGRLNHYSAPPPIRRRTMNYSSPDNDTTVRAPAAHGEAAAGETNCHYLEQHIASIDARMRAGYGSQEGEYLHAQRRAATATYHKAHCTKF